MSPVGRHTLIPEHGFRPRAENGRLWRRNASRGAGERPRPSCSGGISLRRCNSSSLRSRLRPPWTAGRISPCRSESGTPWTGAAVSLPSEVLASLSDVSAFGRSPTTVGAYELDLREFCEWVGGTAAEGLRAFAAPDDRAGLSVATRGQGDRAGLQVLLGRKNPLDLAVIFFVRLVRRKRTHVRINVCTAKWPEPAQRLNQTDPEKRPSVICNPHAGGSNPPAGSSGDPYRIRLLSYPAIKRCGLSHPAATS